MNRKEETTKSRQRMGVGHASLPPCLLPPCFLPQLICRASTTPLRNSVDIALAPRSSPVVPHRTDCGMSISKRNPFRRRHRRVVKPWSLVFRVTVWRSLEATPLGWKPAASCRERSRRVRPGEKLQRMEPASAPPDFCFSRDGSGHRRSAACENSGGRNRT